MCLRLDIHSHQIGVMLRDFSFDIDNLWLYSGTVAIQQHVTKLVIII